MSNFFRSRTRDRGDDLERQLANLEIQASEASSGYETQFLNRAGNLCVEAGQPGRALGFYGRAIDAYLESGRFNAAEVLCRKVLEIAPQAVRARCTLAWLALGKGHQGTTRGSIAEYVQASQRAGQQSLAARQLMMMAEATSSVDLREEIADHLLRLDATAEADHVHGLVYQERNGLRPPMVPDEGKLWGKLLRAALMGPQELRQAPSEADDDSGALPSLASEEIS